MRIGNPLPRLAPRNARLSLWKTLADDIRDLLRIVAPLREQEALVARRTVGESFPAAFCEILDVDPDLFIS